MAEEQTQPITFAQAVGIFFAIFALVAAVALMLFWPWLTDNRLGGEPANSYSHLGPGRSQLYRITSADGTHIGWESQNIADLPIAYIISLISEDIYLPIGELLGFDVGAASLSRNFNIRTVNFVKKVVIEMDPAGYKTARTSQIYIRTEKGEHLLAEFGEQTETVSSYTPPILEWPPDLDRASFSSETIGIYRRRNTVFESEVNIYPAVDVPERWVSYSPCVSVTRKGSGIANYEISGISAVEQTYCTGIGLVSETRFDVQDQIVAVLEMVSTTAADVLQNPIDTFDHSASLDQPTALQVDLEEWEVQTHSELVWLNFAEAPSQPPTHLPTESPFVISSRKSGVMTAIDAETAEVVWTFDSGNTNHGQIGINPYNGLLYFGSINKKLMVVTQHGAFVDAFQTRDSVVSRPVFGPSTVWFGSEDGRIFCAPHSLDPAQTDVFDAGNAVVSSPVLLGSTAVFGTDGGQLVAVNTACEPVWEQVVDGPIDAPLTANAAGTVFFAGHSQIGAIDGRTGEMMWSNEVASAFRFEPVLAQGLVLANDQAGVLHAYDQTNGQLAWSRGDEEFVGRPLVIGNQLLSNLTNNQLGLFNLDGQLIKTWPVSVSQAEQADEINVANDLVFSPIVVDDKIYTLNKAGFVFELAAP
ncbi:MAG: PQQ-binding-like beta-propeller repeat protein [Chloroflexota bacterium]